MNFEQVTDRNPVVPEHIPAGAQQIEEGSEGITDAVVQYADAHLQKLINMTGGRESIEEIRYELAHVPQAQDYLDEIDAIVLESTGDKEQGLEYAEKTAEIFNRFLEDEETYQH